MKSPSCRPTAADKSHLLFTKKPLDADGLSKEMVTTKTGGISFFLGVVRDKENDHPINAIHYDFYPAMAEKEMKNVIALTKEKWFVDVAVHHRLGRVPIGEASLLVVCAGVHRKEAFDACQFVVDEIKAKVPIWKVSYEWAR